MTRGVARLAAALAAVVVAVPAGSATAGKPDPWKKLYRPLRVPRIAPGTPCDTSAFSALSTRPVYPVLMQGEGDRATVSFFYPPPPNSLFAGSEWGGQKVMWKVRYGTGRVLIRGRRLDGPEEIRFEGGLIPARERRYTSGGSHPSFTRLRAAGCYGYQIDTPRSSYVLVFEAFVWR